MDPYITLGVPYDASLEEIKKAHRRLAKRWHPDKNGGSKEAEEKFKQLQAAYECLSDPHRRQHIDSERAKKQAEAEAEAAEARRARARPRAASPPFGSMGYIPWLPVAILFGVVMLFVALIASKNGGSNTPTT